MLVSTIFPFTLLGAALAAPSSMLVQGDLTTFTDAFTAVGAAISNFDTSILALSPTSDIPSSVTDLTAKSNLVLEALNKHSGAINASAILSLTDSLGLLKLANQLAATTNTTINDLTLKKSVIDTAKQGAFVVTQLTTIKSATQGFIAAIVSHVPSAVRQVAQTQVKLLHSFIEICLLTCSGIGCAGSYHSQQRYHYLWWNCYKSEANTTWSDGRCFRGG